MTNKSLASVILPVYNQAGHIRKVAESHITALRQLHFRWEMLLVVNGPSTDNSFEICQTLQEQYPEVRAFSIADGGWGRAVRFGLSEARGELLCFANSARTQSKDLILMLLYGSVHDDCVIKANRKLRAGWMRRIGSLLYNLECRTLFDLPYWDVNGTPKVFPRKMHRLLELVRNDDLVDLEFVKICREQDYPLIEVPTFSTARFSGGSTTNFRSALKLYAGAWQFHRNANERDAG